MKEHRYIGHSVPRVDAQSKVNGSAAYCDDIFFRNMVYGKLVHSPYAHARILGIDTSAAEALPGVCAVITAKDFPVNRNVGEDPGWILAEDEVVYIGDPVVLIGADSEAIAAEAARLVRIEYEELPAVLTLEEARKPDAPMANFHSENNLSMDLHSVRGDVEGAFEKADTTVTGTFHFPFVMPGYLEPNSATAVYANGELNIWCGSQAWHRLKAQISERVGVPLNRVIIHPLTMGGAFGGKSEQITPELAAMLAIRTGRPAKLCRTREEVFYDSHPTVEMIVTCTLALDRKGHFLARKTEYIGDVGGYAVAGPWVLGVAAYRADTLYQFQAVEVWAKGYRLNRTPNAAYRGYGNPQAHFALESLIDMAAEKLQMDPTELRRINYTKPNSISIHGYHISSCGLQECLSRAKDLIHWDAIRQQKRYGHGVGCASLVHAAGSRAGDPEFPGDGALLSLAMDGKLTVYVGESEFGQGAKTVMAQVVAEEFGVDPSEVKVEMGDTGTTPFATGTHGSKLTTILANAVLACCEAAKRIILDEVRTYSGAGPVHYEGRAVRDGRDEVLMTLEEALEMICLKRSGAPLITSGEYRPASVMLDPTGYGNLAPTYPFGVHAAEVTVDVETGFVHVDRIVAVHDSGQIINPQMALGEVYGGNTQAFAFSLYEDLGIAENGILHGGTLLEYKMPTAMDVPQLTADFVQTMDPHGPYGAKSLGEPPIVSVLPAIANAIYDAVGIRLTDAPFTPQKVLQAIRRQRFAETHSSAPSQKGKQE